MATSVSAILVTRIPGACTALLVAAITIVSVSPAGIYLPTHLILPLLLFLSHPLYPQSRPAGASSSFSSSTPSGSGTGAQSKKNAKKREAAKAAKAAQEEAQKAALKAHRRTLEGERMKEYLTIAGMQPLEEGSLEQELEED
ncbi:hypothetical protein R3P38DRAFT_3296796 [Favolaschia claudopus]|uniref:Small EDRK-rich factor-like N-terminal domain-containing protein n=1 Tax=Favolaschia claudopus TaxID=2862362 RepID=A0AAV9Z7N7_9AGAR